MKKYFCLLLVILFTKSAFSGEWKRISSDVLSFEGIIEEGELQKLTDNWDDKISKLIVNSPGGHTVTGIRMGNFLANKKFDIEVQGECMSSCANYLFTTANQKDITNGVVGFHGNGTAALLALRGAMVYHTKEEFTEIDIMELRSFFQINSKKELLALYDEYVEATQMEKELFLKIGVDQALFDRTQAIDKGMGDENEYSFLLPKAETFIRYGIKNVIGSQSQQILETSPIFVENAKNGFDVIID